MPTEAVRSKRTDAFVVLMVFLVGLVAVFARRPDALRNPQFYIEDGREWYAQAHDLGPLHALVLPHRGYFVLVQRIGAMLALCVSLRMAPVVMALFGAAIDVLPAVFLASSRFARLVPSRAARFVLAAFVLAAPNAWTLTANTTNSMWYLALLAAFVIVAEPPEQLGAKCADVIALVLAGLSGPFAILLTPIAAATWWRRRLERWAIVPLGVTAACSAIQLASIAVSTDRSEPRMALGADASKFAKLLVKRVFYEALFGQVGGVGIFTHAWGAVWTSRGVLLGALLAGAATVAVVMFRGPFELRALVAFAGLTFVAALAFPGSQPADARWWDLLMPPANGNRYFLIPVVALLFSWAWMAASAPLGGRIGGGALLAVACAVGIPLNWREPPYENYDFPDAVRRYDAAQPGEMLTIMTPPGSGMVLTKRSDEPVLVAPDECGGAVSVAPMRLASEALAWEGSVARTTGGDPYVIFGVPRQYVCGIRVTFTLASPDGARTIVQGFWGDGEARDINAHSRNSASLVETTPATQSVVFHVHDTIDRFRFDPGTTPGLVFELRGLELLTEERGPG